MNSGRLSLRSLEDPRRIYELDPSDGRYTDSLCKRAEDLDEVRCSGFASEMTVDLWKRKRSLFGIFVDADRVLNLWISGSKFVFDPSMIAERKRPAPFVRRFTLKKGGTSVYAVSYWSADLWSWPTCGDIFSFIVENTQCEDERMRFIDVWSAIRAGQEVTIRA